MHGIGFQSEKKIIHAFLIKMRLFVIDFDCNVCYIVIGDFSCIWTMYRRNTNMKQQRIISLLSAAVTAIAVIPVCPAAAAEPESGKTDPVRIHHIESDCYFSSRETCGTGEESGLELQQFETCRGFSASWQNVTPETETLFLAGKLTPLAEDFAALPVLEANTAVQSDLTGQDASFGWRTRFAEAAGNDTRMTDCYLVEGFGKARPALPDDAKLGTLSCNAAAYDIYLLQNDRLSESPVQAGEKWQTVQEYWLIRTSGITPDAESGEYQLSADLYGIFSNLSAQFDMQPGEWCESAFFLDIREGSGTAASTYLDICTPVADGYTHETLSQSGETADGFQWDHLALPAFKGSVLEPGENGQFRCAWNDTPGSFFEVGKHDSQAIACDAEHPVRYEYALTLSGLGQACAGVCGSVQYGQMPDDAGNDRYLSSFFIIDGWLGERAPFPDLPVPALATEWERLGEVMADGAVYDVYRKRINPAVFDAEQTPSFCSIRRENLLTDPDAEFGNSVDLSAHLQAYRTLGQFDGALRDTGLFVLACSSEADGKAIGSAEITRNTLMLRDDKAAVQPMKQNVTGDANCDGSLDVADAVLVARVVTEDTTAEITRQGILNGDADGDSQLTGNDVTMLLKAISRQIKF